MSSIHKYSVKEKRNMGMDFSLIFLIKFIKLRMLLFNWNIIALQYGFSFCYIK